MAEMRKRTTTLNSEAGELLPAQAADLPHPPKALHEQDSDDKYNKSGGKSDIRDHLVAEAVKRDAKWESLWYGGLIFVTVLAFITRMYKINNPDVVVFDEVHFGKFASYYLRREYYFDVHPPLGKMLLALTGWFVGYDGHFLFDNIGDSYISNNVPYIGMRLFPALCGSLLIPLCYLILKEMGVSFIAALFGTMMLVLDNSLVTQSRLILLDSMLLLFTFVPIYTWIRFYKLRFSPFSREWWMWLSLTGVGLACANGVKIGMGYFTLLTVGVATIVDLWRLLDFRRGVSDRVFLRHFAARALCLIFLTLFVYMSFFYAHFAVLTKSGPGDDFMSPTFQAGLKNSDIMTKSVAIPYTANVTIKHKESNSYLHSHFDKYPLEYEDGRISSAGQQVTAYPHQDPNNYWTIVPVDRELYPPAPEYEPTDEETERGVRYLRHDDIVRLYHPMTQSYLLTHDVASPLTSTNMEFTTLASNDTAKYNDTLFKIHVLSGDEGSKTKTKRHHIRILSVPHKVAAFTSRKSKLPEWGFGQQEVNGNKKTEQASNTWFFEEVFHERIVNGTEIGETIESQQIKEKRLNFVEKFIELQKLMLSHNSGLTASHPYASGPIKWPFLVSGISFWETKEGLKQIYLLGNPLVWWTATIGVLLYATMWIIDRIALRRGISRWEEPLRRFWDRGIGFMFLGWLFHWIPFFVLGRQLFLHHYLPSFIFSVLATTAVVDYLGRVVLEDPVSLAGGNEVLAATIPYKAWIQSQGSSALWIMLIVAIILYTWSFYKFAGISYGLSFDNVDQIKALKWITSWNFQHA